jgi:hypothetical protein
MQQATKQAFPPAHIRQLFDRLFAIFKSWSALRETKSDEKSSFFEAARMFETFATIKKVRPAIYVRDGKGFMAYGKAQCPSKHCQKAEDCSYAMTELEQDLHPFMVRTYVDREAVQAEQFMLFLDRFTNWVNNTFKKVWEAAPAHVPAGTKAKHQMHRAPSASSLLVGSISQRKQMPVAPREAPIPLGPLAGAHQPVWDDPEPPGQELLFKVFIDGIQYFVKGGVTDERESDDDVDYRGFGSETGKEAKINELSKHILAFLNKGKGSLLIGVKQHAAGRHGRTWKAIGFDRTHIAKIQGSIYAMTRNFVPKHQAPNNFSFIVHPMCDGSGVLVPEVVLEMKFERRAECKYHIFLAGDSLMYYERVPGQTPKIGGAVHAVVTYYDRMIRCVQAEGDRQAWKDAREQTLLEIDSRMILQHNQQN